MKYLIEHVYELAIAAVVLIAVMVFLWTGNFNGSKGLLGTLKNNQFQKENNDLTMSDYNESFNPIEYKEYDEEVAANREVNFTWVTYVFSETEYHILKEYDGDYESLAQISGDVDDVSLAITDVTKLDTEYDKGEEKYNVAFTDDTIYSTYASTVMVTISVTDITTGQEIKRVHHIIQFQKYYEG